MSISLSIIVPEGKRIRYVATDGTEIETEPGEIAAVEISEEEPTTMTIYPIEVDPEGDLAP